MMHDELYQYLIGLIGETVNETHVKGFAYFHHGFMPRLLEAGKIKDFDKETLALGWTRAGSLYTMNEAPRRSIECLKKALLLAPNTVEVLQLYVDQLIAVGHYHKAFEYINKLLELEPDRMEFITLRQKIQDDINYDSEPQFQSGDLVWELNEQLAAEQFNSVINTVLETDMNDILLLKKLACAYGAVGHNANYDQVWQAIYKVEPNVKLDAVDQFYKPFG